MLAEISRGRGLPGKAIRLYHEALALDPNALSKGRARHAGCCGDAEAELVV